MGDRSKIFMVYIYVIICQSEGEVFRTLRGFSCWSDLELDIQIPWKPNKKGGKHMEERNCDRMAYEEGVIIKWYITHLFEFINAKHDEMTSSSYILMSHTTFWLLT